MSLVRRWLMATVPAMGVASAARAFPTVHVMVFVGLAFCVWAGLSWLLLRTPAKRLVVRPLLYQGLMQGGFVVGGASIVIAAAGLVRSFEFLVLPIIVVMLMLGVSIFGAGWPRRRGSQRVCKFCDYEYTFGFPPASDPTAPVKCPECGRDWLADLAVGVKQRSNQHLTIGGVILATALLLLVGNMAQSRWIAHVPAPMLQSMVLTGSRGARDAWDALSPSLATYAAPQHEQLFSGLLDVRARDPWRITAPMHAYLLQQLPAMPAPLQQRFYRELVSIIAREVELPQHGRRLIAIDPRHMGSANAESIIRIVAITAGGVEQPFDIEQAWPGLDDATHYFRPISHRDEPPLVVSVPDSAGPLVLRVRLASCNNIWQQRLRSSDDPPGATWVGEFDVPVAPLR
jgi:hypothetical protein